MSVLPRDESFCEKLPGIQHLVSGHGFSSAFDSARAELRPQLGPLLPPITSDLLHLTARSESSTNKSPTPELAHLHLRTLKTEPHFSAPVPLHHLHGQQVHEQQPQHQHIPPNIAEAVLRMQRKEEEYEERDLKERLEQIERLATIRQHDLNSPVAGYDLVGAPRMTLLDNALQMQQQPLLHEREHHLSSSEAAAVLARRAHAHQLHHFHHHHHQQQQNQLQQQVHQQHSGGVPKNASLLGYDLQGGKHALHGHPMQQAQGLHQGHRQQQGHPPSSPSPATSSVKVEYVHSSSSGLAAGFPSPAAVAAAAATVAAATHADDPILAAAAAGAKRKSSSSASSVQSGFGGKLQRVDEPEGASRRDPSQAGPTPSGGGKSRSSKHGRDAEAAAVPARMTVGELAVLVNSRLAPRDPSGEAKAGKNPRKPCIKKPGPARKKCVWCSLTHGHSCSVDQCMIKDRLGGIGSEELLARCRLLRKIYGDRLRAFLEIHGERGIAIAEEALRTGPYSTLTSVHTNNVKPQKPDTTGDGETKKRARLVNPAFDMGAIDIPNGLLPGEVEESESEEGTGSSSETGKLDLLSSVCLAM